MIPADAISPDKAEALTSLMRESGDLAENARLTGLDQLDGGWSRHSYVATYEDDGSRNEYIVRVKPEGSLLDTDLGMEYRILELLQDAAIPTPDVHGFEPGAENPFTGPFFVMDRIPGSAVNVWKPRDQELLRADWHGARGLAEDLVDSLTVLHGIDPGRIEEAPVRDFQQNVEHWQGVYDETRLVRDPVIDEAFRWVASREPDAVEPVLVHGDYRIGNCLIDRGRVTGILDWELAFVGDPRFDLGYLAMDYYAGKLLRPGSELLGGVADREWFLGRYTEKTGRRIDGAVLDTFSALGILMVFSIMTTGLRVYAEGRSEDIRMAWNRFVLPSLRQDLVRLMDW